jgi:hypothetical protein
MATTTLGETLAHAPEGGSYRKHTRLLLAIPVTVISKDGRGQPIQENTATLDVSKRGARLPLLRPPLVNAGIAVRNDAASEGYFARVVWRGGQKALDGCTEIGVEFLPALNAERLWAITAPPDDWREGELSLTPMEKLELIAERSLVPGRSREDLPALPEIAPSEETNADFAAGLQPTINSEPAQSGTEEAISQAPLTAPPAVDPASSSANDLSARLAEILTERVHTSLPAASDAAGSDQSAAKEAVDELESRRKRLEEGLRASGQQVQKELAAVGDACADRLRGSSQRLLATFRDELEKALDDLDQKARAVGTVHEAEKDAVRELESLRQQIEESLQAATRENQKQLAALGASSLEDLARKSQTKLGEFQGELEKAHRRLEDTAAGAVGHQFAKLAAELKGDLVVLRREQEYRINTLRQQMEDHVRDSISSVTPPPPFEPRSLIRPALWTLAAFATLSVFAFFVFVYLSTVRVWRLHSNPPAEFTEPDAAWSASRVALEQQLAEGYWNEAVRNLQQIYPFGTNLPGQPPPEFWLDPQRIGDARLRSNADASRMRYWQTLRKIWNDPRNWDASYEWNTKWLGTGLEPLGEGLRKLSQ